MNFFELLSQLIVIIKLCGILYPCTCALNLYLLLCLAYPGMTSNYLLTNPLLRPQGTNNPYNTLLAETVVCNSPTAPVFNSPGALTKPLHFSTVL